MQKWSELMNNKFFITDMGSSMTSVIDGSEVTVGRYAVWSPVKNSTGHQAIEVSDDLARLMEKYGVPEERVCRLATD